MIKEYKILVSNHIVFEIFEQRKAIQELQDMVNQHINEGWQPIGGAFFSQHNAGYAYMQTMVR